MTFKQFFSPLFVAMLCVPLLLTVVSGVVHWKHVSEMKAFITSEDRKIPYINTKFGFGVLSTEYNYVAASPSAGSDDLDLYFMGKGKHVNVSVTPATGDLEPGLDQRTQHATLGVVVASKTDDTHYLTFIKNGHLFRLIFDKEGGAVSAADVDGFLRAFEFPPSAHLLKYEEERLADIQAKKDFLAKRVAYRTKVIGESDPQNFGKLSDLSPYETEVLIQSLAPSVMKWSIVFILFMCVFRYRRLATAVHSQRLRELAAKGGEFLSQRLKVTVPTVSELAPSTSESVSIAPTFSGAGMIFIFASIRTLRSALSSFSVSRIADHPYYLASILLVSSGMGIVLVSNGYISHAILVSYSSLWWVLVWCGLVMLGFSSLLRLLSEDNERPLSLKTKSEYWMVLVAAQFILGAVLGQFDIQSEIKKQTAPPPPSPPPFMCFADDTPVWTPRGNTPIKELRVGDNVYSFDVESGRLQPEKITEVFRHTSGTILMINHDLRVTSEHPVATLDAGTQIVWKNAGELRIGDCLVDAKRSCLRVSSIEKTVQATPVSNLTVDGSHNFFVGLNGEHVLVHNKTVPQTFFPVTPPPPPPAAEAGEAILTPFQIDGTTTAVMIQRSWKETYSNVRILLGVSHNVFLGKVIRRESSKIVKGIPHTVFSVQVIANIKGVLSKTVEVEQEGGYNSGKLYFTKGEAVVMGGENGGHLLQVGATYVLTTRRGDTGVYELHSYPDVNLLISSDAKLLDLDLRALAGKNKIVREYIEDYPAEISDPGDVKSGHLWNAFGSLTEEEKSAAQKRSDESRALRTSDLKPEAYPPI